MNEREPPNFDALRAERNASCYCACPNGPCEHDWTGPEWVSEDQCCVSVTCARCGTTAMSHSLRVGP